MPIFIGSLAGFINILAGSGSIFTLGFLILSGLPADIANATNRVGVLTQSVYGTYAFRKKKDLNIWSERKLLIPTLSGAIVGVMFAVYIDAKSLEYIILILMVALFIFYAFFQKSIFSSKTTEKRNSNKFLSFLGFFFMGFYGGFIQLGIGLFMMILLAKLTTMKLKEINGIKVFFVFLLNIPVFILFAYYGEIEWKIGIIIGIGQWIGAIIATRFLYKNKAAEKWVKRLIFLMMVIVITKLSYDTFGYYFF